MTTLSFHNRSIHISKLRQGMVVQRITFTSEGKKVPEHNSFAFIEGFSENCFSQVTLNISDGYEIHPSNLILHADC